MASLEAEMKALLASANATADMGTNVTKTAAKVRRKSRDLEEQLAQIKVSAPQEGWDLLANRSRRASRDYSDDNLKAIFDEFDADNSGSIDHSELKNAILKIEGPAAEDGAVEAMMKWADEDNSGCVSFEEFKKVLLKKPPASE